MAKRKTRLWVCHPCKRVWNRTKSEGRYRSCPYCNEPMRAATKYPTASFWEARDRKRKIERRKKEDYEKKRSKAMDSRGRPLHITKEAKRIWRIIEGLKQRPALERWGIKLVEEMYHNCINRGERGEDPMGYQAIPAVRILKRTNPSVKGHYERAVLQNKYHIEVFHQQDITDQKATFIHEVQHWVDDCARLKGVEYGKKYSHAHDHMWRARLRDLKKRLNVRDQKILEA